MQVAESPKVVCGSRQPSAKLPRTASFALRSATVSSNGGLMCQRSATSDCRVAAIQARPTICRSAKTLQSLTGYTRLP
jgi:hypothetical protein